jgi:hypothetical protein
VENRKGRVVWRKRVTINVSIFFGGGQSSGTNARVEDSQRKPSKQNTKLFDFGRSFFSFAPRFEREKTLC